MNGMAVWLCIVLILAAAAAAGGIAFFFGVYYRKSKAEAAIGSAEQEAKRIVGEAVKTAEARKKEIVLEGKDEIHRLRNESEKELADRRKEIQHQERRILQKRKAWSASWKAWTGKRNRLPKRTKRQRNACGKRRA